MTTIATVFPRVFPAPASSADRVNVATNDCALDQFLKTIERRALRMAELATGNRDEALDLVQDAMFGFVRHYADKAEAEWMPLFYRVLANRLNDWNRRRQVRTRWIDAFVRDDDDAPDPLAQVPDPADPGPLLRLAGSEAAGALDVALAALPLRQRQAFLRRLWEGLDVATTAATMRCAGQREDTCRGRRALRRALEAIPMNDLEQQPWIGDARCSTIRTGARCGEPVAAQSRASRRWRSAAGAAPDAVAAGLGSGVQLRCCWRWRFGCRSGVSR
jgi:RNA polymerase sigma-70 factor (ECF subfamily)